MNKRPTLREQIDACRPDSDDLHLPEHAADLAELAEGIRNSADVRAQWNRTQHDDRLIRSAMHEVSLPAGLEQRLLAALLSSKPAPLSDAVDRASSDTAPERPAATVSSPEKGQGAARQHSPLPSRRLFAKVAGTFAAAAAVALVTAAGIFFWPQEPQDVTKDQLANQVQDWLQTSYQPGVQWQQANATIQASFPQNWVQGKIARWGRLPSETEPKVVVYELTSGGNQARLFAITTTRQFPVGSLPYTRLNVSGGMSVGAWQKGDTLYVLAVREGSDSRLDHFLKPRTIG